MFSVHSMLLEIKTFHEKTEYNYATDVLVTDSFSLVCSPLSSLLDFEYKITSCNESRHENSWSVNKVMNKTYSDKTNHTFLLLTPPSPKISQPAKVKCIYTPRGYNMGCYVQFLKCIPSSIGISPVMILLSSTAPPFQTYYSATHSITSPVQLATCNSFRRLPRQVKTSTTSSQFVFCTCWLSQGVKKKTHTWSLVDARERCTSQSTPSPLSKEQHQEQRNNKVE